MVNRVQHSLNLLLTTSQVFWQHRNYKPLGRLGFEVDTEVWFGFTLLKIATKAYQNLKERAEKPNASAISQTSLLNPYRVLIESQSWQERRRYAWQLRPRCAPLIL
jgi:hypothetical protein